MINGTTELIAHIGFPTFTFKSPMIYNPYFEAAGINVVVTPMACQAADFPDFLHSIFRLQNVRGALITMPHKVTTTGLVDELSATAKIAGACNAVKAVRDTQGNIKLLGDMFDGEGFVRGVQRKGFQANGKRALVVGSGGVGSAIAASLAKAGVAHLSLFDAQQTSATSLARRLLQHYPSLTVSTESNDPSGHDLVVNATPMGMHSGDPLPMDVNRLSANTMVGEVVMKDETTAFLAAAKAQGCTVQIGTDMLFEQIPVYLEYFGLPSTTAENLKSLAKISY